MPIWSVDTLKMLRVRNLSDTNRHAGSDISELRGNTIDVHVHTERSCFFEPLITREMHHNPGHQFCVDVPHTVMKRNRKGRPQPLSISHSSPCLPIIVFQDSKPLVGPDCLTDPGLAPTNSMDDKADVKRKRRHGMQNYPTGVRQQLRDVRSRSRCYDHCPSYYSAKGEASSPSLYSDTSGYGEQITVSSVRGNHQQFEPPSWFSDHSVSEEELRRGSGEYSRDIDPGRLQRIINLAVYDNSTTGSERESFSEDLDVPSTAKSWETFRIPSIPPSPVNSAPSRLPPPRNPNLPPADYFLHKEEYDDAAIAKYGALPAEWLAYARAYYENRV